MEDLRQQAVFDRMRQAAKVKTYASLAEILGITPQAVSDARKKGNVPNRWLLHIARKYGVALEWLSYGRDASGARQAEDAGGDMLRVPRVKARLSLDGNGFAACDEAPESCVFPAAFLRRRGDPARMALLRVSGDSMQPEFRDGDLALVDQGQRELYPDKFYAVGVEGMVFLRLLSALPGRLLLISLNAAYPPFEAEARGFQEEIRIVGRVVWWCREG
jgi:phage repressor protein C with HTH and peptisase S24 domain